MKKLLSIILGMVCFLGSVSAQNPTLVYPTNDVKITGGPVGKVLIGTNFVGKGIGTGTMTVGLTNSAGINLTGGFILMNGLTISNLATATSGSNAVNLTQLQGATNGISGNFVGRTVGNGPMTVGLTNTSLIDLTGSMFVHGNGTGELSIIDDGAGPTTLFSVNIATHVMTLGPQADFNLDTAILNLGFGNVVVNAFGGASLGGIITVTGGGGTTYIDNSGVTSPTFTLPDFSNLNYTLSVYGAGTAYSLTAVSAAINLGTTDPVLVIDKTGTYRIKGSVQLLYNGATFAAGRTVTLKLRRTNNTAADLTDGTITITTPTSVPALTGTWGIFEFEAIYNTSNTDDSITIFADVSAVPGAGSLDAQASGTSIIAERLY